MNTKRKQQFLIKSVNQQKEINKWCLEEQINYIRTYKCVVEEE